MGRRLPVADRDFRPAYVVWELTLACDQRCTHCGSRAGTERSGELTTEEAVRLARQLGEMRAEEVVLIGGEAYLHPGFLDVVGALRSAGVRPVMTTGGRGVSSELARAMAGAGLAAASVSIDGLERTHDRMRATPGGFAAATAALNHLAHAGVAIAANTNVNRWNEAELEPLYEHLAAQGIRSWQVQLTTPLGRAADRPDMILQPYDLLGLVPRIARLKERALADGISLMPGNNLGYFGPEEALLRSPHAGGRDHFRGCQAGRYVLGIESNGAIKGCPSLQAAFVGGNVRDRSLRAIWDDAPELRFARARDDEPTAHLWGYCAACDFADTCMGGCTFTAYAFFGRAGNNPYCHFRARELAGRGLRERLVQTASAPGDPFDHARFEIVTEPLDAPEPRVAPRERLLQVRRRLDAPGGSGSGYWP